jgi:triosephosphate isomerase
MNLRREPAAELAAAIVQRRSTGASAEVVLCPPAVYLGVVGRTIAGSDVALGAQNVYDQPDGAYTGEISGDMLLDMGCRYVIIGHSERRHILGETNQTVNRKALAALKSGLQPIVCVGETLAQREAGQTEDVVAEQFFGSLAGLTSQQMLQTVIAYEPVWAIGTGKVASPEQAEQVHADLRRMVASRFGGDVAERVRILYGGSVKAENAGELLAQPNIDGALVGGASLKAAEFWGIIQAAEQVAATGRSG